MAAVRPEPRVWGNYFRHWSSTQRREFFKWKWHLAKKRLKTGWGLAGREASKVDPGDFVDLSSYLQGHGLHHGGQLFSAGEPVVNNQVLALGGKLTLGCRWRGQLRPRVSAAEPRRYRQPAGRAARPRARHLHPCGFTPGNWLELFAIQWWGQDFVSNEGDGTTTRRAPTPLLSLVPQVPGDRPRAGTPIESGLTLDTEFRFHRIDDRRSIAIGTSPWEYSYR